MGVDPRHDLVQELKGVKCGDQGRGDCHTAPSLHLGVEFRGEWSWKQKSLGRSLNNHLRPWFDLKDEHPK